LSRDDNTAQELQQLHQQTMRQLEAIADAIKAGELDADQGAAQARALIAITEQQSTASMEAAKLVMRRNQRRALRLALLVVVAAALVALALVLARINLPA
jgi:predicted nucleic acid-binding Zn ribbon protein